MAMDFSVETELYNPVWDDFLEQNALGQFQQSSKWARIKAKEGWDAARVLAYSERDLEGGFQLLWKKSRLGRIGYISKGPVLRHERQDWIDAMLRHTGDLPRQLQLKALVVQPPDSSRITSYDLQRHRFSKMPVPTIMDGTLIIDVSGGREAILNRMNRTMRQEVRQAIRKGVVITDGSRSEMGHFFALMIETCRRQQTSPNPARLELLEAIWDEFQPNVRLSFARVKGQAVAGLLSIGFGKRLTLWKKGWNSEEVSAHPNPLLHADALWWANANGYQECDVVSLDRQIAEHLLARSRLTERQLHSRHMFNVRLGGEPRLLPRAQIHIVNPIARIVLESFVRWKSLRNLLIHTTRRM